jgi:hypothetical protein
MDSEQLPTSLPSTVTHIPGVNVQPVLIPTPKARIADHVAQMRPGSRTDQTLPDGREIVYFIDEDDAGFGFLAHDRKAAHQWLDAFLDNLDPGEIFQVDFKREHMTEEQIKAMPEV